jgi:hypothetical protein
MKVYPGDHITTDYYNQIEDKSNWHCKGNYEVKEIRECENGSLSFILIDLDNQKEIVCGDRYDYLNGYEYIGDRLLQCWKVNLNTFDWERVENPEIDFIDEIFITKSKEQTELFV